MSRRHAPSLIDLVGLAARWVEVLEPVAGPPATGEDLTELAGRLALAAGSGLHDPDQAVRIGEQLGRQLAEANLTSPDAVRRAVTALGDHWLGAEQKPSGSPWPPAPTGSPWPPAPSVPGQAAGPRQTWASGNSTGSGLPRDSTGSGNSGLSWEQTEAAAPRVDPACVTAMQGGLAAGHAAAVQQLLLSQQEAIHRATVSARDLARDRMRHEAAHDRLTGLANRAHFLRRLEATLSGGSGRVALCLLRLNGFGAVNLAYGHTNGDLVLRRLAARLAAEVDGTPAVLARLDGTTFAVLLPGARPGRSDELAARMLAVLEPRVPIDDARSARVTGRAAGVELTAGVKLTAGQTRLDAALRACDLALHSARAAALH